MVELHEKYGKDTIPIEIRKTRAQETFKECFEAYNLTDGEFGAYTFKIKNDKDQVQEYSIWET